MLLQGHYFFSSSLILSFYSFLSFLPLLSSIPPYTLPHFSFLASRIELSCSSNRQHGESLVHPSSLTDGYFTPIIWVLCVCLCRCVWMRKRGVSGLPLQHTHTHIFCHGHSRPPAFRPASCACSIDGVSELRRDVLINLDTQGIDLTSCCNDLLVLVKDHCLSGPQPMHGECLIVMETIIMDSERCSICRSLLYFSVT